MKFGNFEIPPILKKKEETPAAPFERAPQPAPLDVEDLMELAAAGNEEELTDELSAYAQEWNEYATDRNLYVNNGTDALWKAVGEAKGLVQAFQSEYGRTETKAKLEALFSRMNGELADAVREKVTAHTDRIDETNARVQEHPVAESHQELKSTVADIESLRGKEPGSMMDTLRRSAAQNPEQYLNSEEWLASQKSKEDDVLELTEKDRIDDDTLILTEEDMTPEQPDTLELTEPVNAKMSAQYERVATEQQAMQHAEREYLAAYKKYHKKLGAREGKEPKELQDLADVYNVMRLEYRDALDSSAFDRIKAKMDAGEISAERGYKLLDRYNRLVTYNEVIKPAAEKRYQARLEAKGESAVGTFKKGVSWFLKKNQAMEQWLQEKTGSRAAARLTRAIATTALVGGGAALLGSFGAAGFMAAAGWGTVRIARSLGSSVLGATVGGVFSELHGATFGKKRHEERVAAKESAEQELSENAVEGRNFLSFSSIDDLEAYDRAQQQLLAVADDRNLEKLEKEKLLIKALVAFGVGAGTSAFLAHLPSVEALPVPVAQGAGVPHGAVSHTDAPAVPHETHAAPTASQQPVSHTEAPHQSAAHHEAPKVSAHHESRVRHMHPAGTEKPVGISPVSKIPEGSAAPAPEAAAPEAPSAAPATPSGYEGPFTQEIKLPEGMDPNSPEAVAYLDKAYNPQAFEHASGAAAAPAPEALEAPSAAPAEALHTEAPPSAPAETSVPAPEHTAPSAPIEHPGHATSVPDTEQPKTVTIDGEKIQMPPESAYVNYPEGTPGLPTAHDPDLIPAEGSGSVEHIGSAPESHHAVAAPEHHAIQPNEYGFDLGTTGAGLDAKGNIFVHVARTGDLKVDNDAAYAEALKQVRLHPGKEVFFVDESRSFFGSPKYEVYGVRSPQLEGVDQATAANYPPQTHQYPDMKPPTESELKPLT